MENSSSKTYGAHWSFLSLPAARRPAKHPRPTRHSIPSAEHRGADVPDEEVRPSGNLRVHGIVGSALGTLALAWIPDRDCFTTYHNFTHVCRPMCSLRRSSGLRQWCQPRRTEGQGYIPVQGSGQHLCVHVMSCVGASAEPGERPWCILFSPIKLAVSQLDAMPPQLLPHPAQVVFKY